MGRYERNEYNIDWSGVKQAVDYYKRGNMDLFGFYLEKSIPGLQGIEKLLTSAGKPSMVFRPISEAPEDPGYMNEILCRFWYPYLDGHWVYFMAQANGAKTMAPGYAPPEEFCTLPCT